MPSQFSFQAGSRAAAIALIAGLAASSTPAAVIGTPQTVNGFTFINFDPALPAGSVGSNVNGISNSGHVVGTTVDANNESTFLNFTGTPALTIPLITRTGATAFGINRAGQVVGTQNGAAFILRGNRGPQSLDAPASATNAFGINDFGNIVGQFTSGNATPGFIVESARSRNFITINAPSGPNIVNAQGINNFGLVLGFYQGTDGQAHGFMANAADAHNGVLTGTPVADPVIPVVNGEPGATFVFSQLLGVNDRGIAVGYYGDSTNSQHGFIYDTNTGTYTFLDDPAEAFNNGVEVTQITGIADSGEIAGFYTDANGAAHSFIACPTYAFCPDFPNDLPNQDPVQDRERR
jgi:uncharacterized membrane protein